MAFNDRQKVFINRIQKEMSRAANELYSVCYELKESFQEEFATGQDNDLSVKEDELLDLGLTYTDVLAAVNLFGSAYVNLWVGDAVATRQYGKDVRRVKT